MTSTHMLSQTPDQPFIVGRQAEIKQFAALIGGQTSYNLLNIYGPGGIGKTVVGNKMKGYAAANNIPFAFIEGDRQDLTPLQILYEIAAGLIVNSKLEEAFTSFNYQYQNYHLVSEIMRLGGGMQTMFNVIGTPTNPEALSHLLSNLGASVNQEVKQIVSNRFALERYLRGIEQTLTTMLGDALATSVASTQQTLAILIDTYEQMEPYDDWVYRHFRPVIPTEVKVIILGRNALPRLNFDWSESGHQLNTMALPELPEEDAKTFLRYHKLQEPIALDQIYRFTGGYPLLLVLVVYLSKEAGGWHNIGALEYEADRDRVATKLLERILREERVQTVQNFLEKGVVARWFTPEIISEILKVSAAEGRSVYDRLYRHSFTERHPYGLKFHDKIRELLIERLKFYDKPEYDRIVALLRRYYADKAEAIQEIESSSDLTLHTTPQKEPNTFGQMLSYYRRKCDHPERGGLLTQKQFAECVSQEWGVDIYDVTISNWERGRTQISQTDRRLLVAIIRVLHQYGGIQSVADANQLLFSGGYRDLDDKEKRHIFDNE